MVEELVMIDGQYYYFGRDNSGYLRSGWPSNLMDQGLYDYLKGLLDRLTTPEMTATEKMWAVYMNVSDRANFPYRTNYIPYYHGLDWPYVYAREMMNYGASVCYGYSSIMGYVASMLGYNVVMYANYHHGWCMADGLVYDPVFRQHRTYPTIIFGESLQKCMTYNFGDYEEFSYAAGTYHYVPLPSLY